MTIFVDASAAVSMLMLEPDAEFLFGLLDDDQDRLWSPIAVWETTVAITRTRVISADRAYDDVNALAERLGFR